jgi:hypothetical protein
MIKNYTSSVPADRSVSYIERKLVAHSARQIMKQYGTEGELAGIYFLIQTGDGEIAYRLPAKVDRVRESLRDKIRRPRKGTLERLNQQAERTAWKLLADWVDVQLSLIELGQAEFLEIFLPYVYDPAKQETFFERIKAGGYKLLPQGAGKEK